jgi:hypothetical protein
MSRDPFRLEGPACISFSGGRTSGYMLWRILQSHDGVLPPDVVVCFANTGKEHPETLDFVQQCSERWSVPIVWLEYRSKAQFVEVDHAAASRNGEPFEALIRDRNFLPNPVARFCTAELKVLTIKRYMNSIGHGEYLCAVGLRADEPRRVSKLLRDPSGGTRGVERIAPFANAGIGVQRVGEFWATADFDLQLPGHGGVSPHGNCDLCFLKGGNQILSLLRQDPGQAAWWMRMEGSISNPSIKNGGTFRTDRPRYAEMHRMAMDHGELFPFADDSIEDCSCTD